MGLIKKSMPTLNGELAPSISVQNTKPESGTDAAIERLKNSSIPEGHKSPLPYKQRDFDAEARGKTKCVQFEAALMSPAIAGMAFKTMAEYLALVKEAADAGVKYTFGD